MRVKLDPADKVFSQWIRLRDGKCLRCGALVELNGKGLPVNLQASHFQSRGHENTRFDPENVCTLCAACHTYLGGRPAEHFYWQVERIGQELVDELIIRSHIYHKRDRKSERLYWIKRLKDDYGIR